MDPFATRPIYFYMLSGLPFTPDRWSHGFPTLRSIADGNPDKLDMPKHFEYISLYEYI